ncbi:MAG: DUF6655 family protein [Pirellulaceae bacterium]
MRAFPLLYLICFMAVACAGCGTTQSFKATEQLLMSDAVDATVAQLDFTALSGRKVYLDTTYLKTVRSALLVDSDYVISSIRQQMLADRVMLVEGREEADLVAEARIGALGLDGHNVTYGLPANNLLRTASSVFVNAPAVPSVPELSLARREAKQGAAKIAVFAYERDTRTPVWQSGIAKASSSARDTWVFGVGPWQRGSIYDGTRFAGTRVGGMDLLTDREKQLRSSADFKEYYAQHSFEDAPKPNLENAAPASEVKLAAATEAVEEKPKEPQSK